MLQVRGLYKDYEGKALLRGVHFEVAQDEIICLLGPSGSGKSTILRIIAGLESAEQGEVCWEGNDITRLPTHLRHFGLMFQDYALFPHRNVAQNAAFGLKMQGVPAAEQQSRVAEALEMVKMSSFARRRVSELSGGEQQRVALARSLAPRPRLLMLDEPLGALDHQLRESLLSELRSILRQAKIPAIYVTHDHEEAFAIADRLILLREGRIEQDASPAEVFARPRSAWVAAFFGMGNLVEGKVVSAQPLRVSTACGEFSPGVCEQTFPPGTKVQLLLRPENAQIVEAVEDSLRAVVVDQRFQGDHSEWMVQTPGGVELRVFSSQSAAPGDVIHLRFDPRTILCLPADSA